MIRLEEIFEHLPSVRILVCINCAVAVPPQQIVTHLKRQHGHVPPAERPTIAAAAHELPSLAWRVSELQLPTRAQQPLPGLIERCDGLVCQSDGCGYTCTSKRGIENHCKKQHGWRNTQRRGGDARKKQVHAPNKMWLVGQPCQRVFTASGWPAFVALESAPPPVDAENLYNQVKSERRRIENAEAAEAACATIHEGRRQQADPWLELTGWLVHLKGRIPSELLSAREPPTRGATASEQSLGEDGVALKRACRAMRDLIHEAFSIARPEVVGRPALELIQRKELGAPSNEKPFYSNHNAATVRKYREKIVNILCYLWRSCEQSPAYEFTHNQSAHMLELKRLAKRSNHRAQLKQSCLNFWIALLDHSLPDDEHKSPLLSGVAVLGLKPDHLGGGWAPAYEFSPVLSAIITTSKALVVLCGYKLHLSSRDDDRPTVHELVRDMAERFMVLSCFSGSITPMNRLLRQRTYARTLAKQRNAPGLVSWDGDKILISQESFTMDDVRRMVHGMCEELRQELMRDVLLLKVDDHGNVMPGCKPLPALNMDTLVDQPAELGQGYSFLKHPANHFDSDEWQDWLMRRVTQEPALQRRFWSGSSLRSSAINSYTKAVRKFKEGLFALVHFTAGAPARGTEITSIMCENDCSGHGQRGVFVEGGLVAFVTTYHKGYSFSKRVKTIHRYVPRVVSELVVYFLALARPFITDVLKLHRGVKGRTPFMWEPAPEKQAGFSSGTESEVEASDGDDPADASDSNHTSSSSSDSDSRGNTEPSHAVAQSRATPSVNPDGYWGTDRVRRVLRHFSFKWMNARLGTRSWRHSYPAIHRELSQDDAACDFIDTLYFDKAPTANDARALQSGHSLQTEESNYGRLLLESPNQTHRERQQFRAVSLDWHRLLSFSSTQGGCCPDPAKAAAVDEHHKREAIQRWTTLANTNMKEAFRALLRNPSAEFRSKQEEALAAIASRQMRVLVVMATAAGKSMLFMLPAAISPGGVTVVIAPLNSLRDNLIERCIEMGIRCCNWEGTRPAYGVSIVLVIPEGAVSPSFGRFVDEMRTLRRLDRIVIDECHVLMESTEKWRPDVLRLIEMTQKGTQVVYLTATLPLVEQASFLRLAGLDERCLTICREARTSRRNISYRVHKYSSDYTHDQLDDLAARLLVDLRGRLGEDAQIIVYCPKVESTKRLAERLRCPAYYREMGTASEKAVALRQFVSGAVKLITATNALGLGLDAPGVSATLHIAMCGRLKQYIQESGRAGRGGQRSEVIVLVPARRRAGEKSLLSIPTYIDEPARQFLSTASCRRVAIDRYMDGREDRRECEAGEEPCDRCGKQRSRRAAKRPAVAEDNVDAASQQTTACREMAARVEFQQRRIELQQRASAEHKASELDQLDLCLRRWQGACVLCMAQQRRPAIHSWRECPDSTRASIQHTEQQLKQLYQVKFDRFASCYRCWAPQAICDRWAEKDSLGAFYPLADGHCQYEGVLMPAIAALIVHRRQQWKQWVTPLVAAAGLPTCPLYWGNCARVLGTKTDIGQRNASLMAKFFLESADERLPLA